MPCPSNAQRLGTSIHRRAPQQLRNAESMCIYPSRCCVPLDCPAFAARRAPPCRPLQSSHMNRPVHFVPLRAPYNRRLTNPAAVSPSILCAANSVQKATPSVRAAALARTRQHSQRESPRAREVQKVSSSTTERHNGSSHGSPPLALFRPPHPPSSQANFLLLSRPPLPTTPTPVECVPSPFSPTHHG
ncbi:hypothetical protein BC628DRAFT_1347472 [Trametes gibbosa]|nr:hypothetical protein BC628DRAFT_1347472 [Trametes gibbosa]